MSKELSNNRRIAKNTVMLYIRMLLATVVSLYTSRVVLQTLGVEDYGIYGVVGGVVSMFSFLNAAMSGATSRFLTVEIGKGESEKFSTTFSTAVITHWIIAIIVLLLSETFGLWYVSTKLVIPSSRAFAANVVYQLSIISALITIIQVPYNAILIAHEKMDIYAYVEIVNVSLKLLIVFLLKTLEGDKLILYATLLLAVSIIVAFVYRIYCLIHFPESHFKLVFKKDTVIPMLKYTGWNFYIQFCTSAKQQGTNLLVNLFYGVALNAASSVATTVFGALQAISYNVIQAFRPQIVKNFARGDVCIVCDQVTKCIKFSLMLFLLVATPVFIEIQTLLKLWLGVVPTYTNIFCRLLIIGQLFGLLTNSLFTIIEASGDIKKSSVFSGTCYLLVVPFTYLAYSYIDGRPESAYVIGVALNVVIFISYLLIASHTLPGLNLKVIFKTICTLLIISFISSVIPVYVQQSMNESFLRLFLDTLIFVVIYLILVFLTCFDNDTLLKIKSKFVKPEL